MRSAPRPFSGWSMCSATMSEMASIDSTTSQVRRQLLTTAVSTLSLPPRRSARNLRKSLAVSGSMVESK
eukprot:1134416-Prymnesium_polylepis.1